MHQGSGRKPPAGGGLRNPSFQPQLSEPGILGPTWGPRAGWAACPATKPQAHIGAMALASHSLDIFLLERALGSGMLGWGYSLETPFPTVFARDTGRGGEAGSHEATGSEKQSQQDTGDTDTTQANLGVGRGRKGGGPQAPPAL